MYASAILYILIRAWFGLVLYNMIFLDFDTYDVGSSVFLCLGGFGGHG